MRSTTIALRPTSAAVPVRSDAGILRCERAIGRRAASAAIETSRKTISVIAVPVPAALTSAATSAPAANGARKKPSVAISPMASTTAAMSHNTHGSISRYLEWRGSRQRRAGGKVLRVERPQVLELLADADQLDDADFVGNAERDPALGGAVELGEVGSAPPVTSTASPNSFALRRGARSRRSVASTVISVSCGASGICLVITRRTLVSSAIRSVWVWRRPRCR